MLKEEFSIETLNNMIAEMLITDFKSTWLLVLPIAIPTCSKNNQTGLQQARG
jgi:hypothetical protein